MKRGNWALFHRTDIRDADGSLYLRRWRIVQTPWCAIYLHAIHRPDTDCWLHDHPWPFASMVLVGGYMEIWANSMHAANLDHVHMRVMRPFRPRLMRRGHFHAIRGLGRTPTWTLVFCGPRRGHWGYATLAGFVPAGDGGFPDYERAARARIEFSNWAAKGSWGVPNHAADAQDVKQRIEHTIQRIKEDWGMNP